MPKSFIWTNFTVHNWHTVKGNDNLNMELPENSPVQMN